VSSPQFTWRQLFNTPASDWRNSAKRSKMRADRVDHCRLLTDEQLARDVKHQAALLLRRPGRNEPHVSSSDSLADGLGVCGRSFVA